MSRAMSLQSTRPQSQPGAHKRPLASPPPSPKSPHKHTLPPDTVTITSTSTHPEHTAHLWVFRSLVHQLSAGSDYATADSQAVHILARLFARYLSDLACLASAYAQASGRSRVQFSDLIPTLDRVGFSLADLHSLLMPSAPAARAANATYSGAQSTEQQSPSPIAPFTPLNAAPSPSTRPNPLPILAPTYGHDTKLVPVSALDTVTATQSIHPSYPIIVDPERHPIVVKKLQSLPARPPPPPSASSESTSSSTLALAAVIVPRTKFPPHVPDACPKFPPPHTYMRTPVMPLHATHTSRAPLLADQRKLMEANLRRLMSTHPKLFSSSGSDRGDTAARASQEAPLTDPAPTTTTTLAPAPLQRHKPRLAAIKAFALSQPDAMWWKHPPTELPKDVLDELASATEEDNAAHDPDLMDVDADPAVVQESPPRAISPPVASPFTKASSPPSAAAAATSPNRTSPEHRPTTLVQAQAPASTSPLAVTQSAASQPPKQPASTNTSPSIKLRLRSPTPVRARSPPALVRATASASPAPYHPRASSPLATSPPLHPMTTPPEANPGDDQALLLMPSAVVAELSAGGANATHELAQPELLGAGTSARNEGVTRASSVAQPLAGSSSVLVDDTSSSGSGSSASTASNRPRVSSGGILRLKIKPLGGVASPPMPPGTRPANGDK